MAEPINDTYTYIFCSGIKNMPLYNFLFPKSILTGQERHFHLYLPEQKKHALPLIFFLKHYDLKINFKKIEV